MSRKPSSQNRMDASGRQFSQKKPKSKLKTVRLNEGNEPPAKKLRPLSLSNPPIFDLTTDDAFCSSPSPTQLCALSQPSRKDVKGKGKETSPLAYQEDDRLWVDKYEPTSEAQLAVHKRKVEDVRQWLLEAFEGGPSAKLRKYRRILALTGPAGTAKTTTLRVLARELGFQILEWRNGTNERSAQFYEDFNNYVHDDSYPDTEALFDKFQAFLTRAMSCSNIFSGDASATTSKLSSGSQAQPDSTKAHAAPQIYSQKRQVVLLEDLPNILHAPTQARFQAALQSFCIASGSSNPGPPVVIIISDSGLRAEQPDDDTWDGGSGGRRWGRPDVLDIRTVLGPALLTSPYVTRIGFNPIAPTLMTKALQALLAQLSAGGIERQVPRGVLEMIVGTSNGDIRSALMALQFACIAPLQSKSGKSRTKGSRGRNAVTGGAKGGNGALVILEAVTRREQSLVLFHLMGKLLYNKRKHDSPASRLSAKDAAKERELDEKLVDPLPLPEWLSHHERKASRVSVEAIAADSPIDSYLLGSYIHQNYTQFCSEIEQCEGVCNGLSWTDWVSGNFTKTPYGFPTLALSTLHALPIPVPRLGQKVCKPAWFDIRARELEACSAVGDVACWLASGKASGVGHLGDDSAENPQGFSRGHWTYTSIATELGGWLRSVDQYTSLARNDRAPPSSHKLFSCLPWTMGLPAVGGEVLLEHEDTDIGGLHEEVNQGTLISLNDEEENSRHWWTEVDDIEDVE
ncbi:Rad17 cell cycle checkpoint protein-domain-containing protein [Scleroderma citrinum]